MKQRKMQGEVTRNVFLLGLVSLFTDLSSELIRPILPFFLTSLGASGFVIGIIGGFMKGFPNLLKVFSGYLSDRIRKRKIFILTGYSISAIFKFGLALAKKWWLAFSFIGLERSGKGIRDAPRDALIAESVKQRGKAFGIHRTMDQIGAILGSILAFIFILIGFSFNKIIGIAALISLISLFPLIWVKEIKIKKAHKFFIELKNLPNQLKLFLLIASLFAVSNFSYMFFILKANQSLQFLNFNFLPIFALPIGLYIIFNLFYASLSIPLGKLADKIGKRKILIFGYLLFSLVCLFFIFINNLILFIAFFAFYGISFAAIEVNQRAYVADLAKTKGTALGTFHTLTGSITLIGGFLAGYLWQLNPSFTFLYGFCLSLISSFLLFFLKDQEGLS